MNLPLPPPPAAAVPDTDEAQSEVNAYIRGVIEAERITSPHGLAAQTLGKVFGANTSSLEENMAEAAMAINGGSLVGVEGTLSSQAVALNALFHRLTQFSFEGPRSAAEFAPI